MEYYRTAGGYFYKTTRNGAVRISEEEFKKRGGKKVGKKFGKKDFDTEDDAAKYLYDNAQDIKWFRAMHPVLIDSEDKLEENTEYLGAKGISGKNIGVGVHIDGTNYFSVLTGKDKKIISEWKNLLTKNKSGKIYIFVQGRHKKIPVIEFCNMLNDNDLLKKAEYINIDIKDKAEPHDTYDTIGVSAKGIWGFASTSKPRQK